MQAVAGGAEAVKQDERVAIDRTLVLETISESRLYWGGSSATGSA